MDEKKRCFNCRWFATVDSGYSNYTVLGTNVHCIKSKNEFFPCEESCSWKLENSKTLDSKPVLVAESCDSYIHSDNHICLDVDGEITIEEWKNDEELYHTAINYGL